MKRTKIFESYWWRLILTVIFIILFISFLKSQKEELTNFWQLLPQANYRFFGLSFVITGLYISLQGWLYQLCYKTAGAPIPFREAIGLFFKRFFIASFIPAGFTVAQYTFTNHLARYNVSKLQNHLASSFYLMLTGIGFCVALIPAGISLLASSEWTILHFIGAAFVICLTLCFVMFLASILSQRGLVYNLARGIFPDLHDFISEWRKDRHSRRFVLPAFVCAFMSHVVLIGLFMSTFATLGLPNTFAIALVSYLTLMIVLILSPIFQGIGLVEFSLTYVLRQIGISPENAIGVTLFYRLFQLWIPFIIGGIWVAWSRLSTQEK